MNKRGVAGLPMLLSVVTLLFVIGMIVFVFALMGTGLQDSATATVNVVTTEVFQESPIQTDAVHWYDFEETSGTVAVDTIGNMNLTDIYSPVRGVTGVSGNAYSFEAVLGSSVDCLQGTVNQAITPDDEFTVGYFVKVQDPDSQWELRYASGSNTGWIMQDAGANVGFRFQQDGTLDRWSNTGAVTDTWEHIMVVHYANDSTDIYKDGLPFSVNTGALGMLNGATAGRLYVGCGVPSYNYGLIGDIDQLILWDRALNSTEAQTVASGLTYETCTPTTPTANSCGVDNCGIDYGSCGAGDVCSANECVAKSQASEVIGDTKDSISGVTDWFAIILVITAMVVLVLLTVLIINAIKRSGFITA